LKDRGAGYDAAGLVTAVGSEVALFQPGDEVFYAGAMDRPGTNSEFHVVDERIVGLKPRSLSFAQAAALPLTSITAWEILFDRMKIPYGSKSPGRMLLIINGAGGVGSILTQLAARLTDLTVIATASRPESRAWVKDFGAHHVADHSKPIDEALKAVGVPEVDYIAAITSTEGSASALARTLKPQGHITFIDNFNDSIMPFKAKSITVSWEMMFHPLALSDLRYEFSAPTLGRGLCAYRLEGLEDHPESSHGTFERGIATGGTSISRIRPHDRQDCARALQ
jgi:zinc-binding alcohol dehydrogenase family protein